MRGTILLMAFFCILFVNCKLIDTENNIISDGFEIKFPSVLFEKSYDNQAWGYVNHGWYLKKTGDVDSISYEKSDSIWLISQDSLITHSEMNRMTSKAGIVLHKVNRNELDSMYSLIGLAVKGPWSINCHGADIGSFTYSAYLYDATVQGYRQIVLYQSGDCDIVNESVAAQKITAWLMNIDALSNVK